LVAVVTSAITAVATGLFSWWKFRKKIDALSLEKTQEVSISDRQKLTEEQRRRIASLEAELSKQTGYWTAKFEELHANFDLKIQEVNRREDQTKEAAALMEKELALQSYILTEAQKKMARMQEQISQLTGRNVELESMVARMTEEKHHMADTIASLQKQVHSLERRQNS